MERTKIKKISSAIEFHQINEILLSEITFPIEGEGIYIKHAGTHYGHVKIQISEKPELGSSICYWYLTEEEFPKGVYREGIEKVLSFFISYLEAIRGERINIYFDILDATFHPVDSSVGDFEIATIQAIINAFDKNLYIPEHKYVYRK